MDVLKTSQKRLTFIEVIEKFLKDLLLMKLLGSGLFDTFLSLVLWGVHMRKFSPDKRAGSVRWDDFYPMFICMAYIWKFSSHIRDEKKYFQTCVLFILICFVFF